MRRRWAALRVVVGLFLGSLLPANSAPQTQEPFSDVRPSVQLPAESAGWDGVIEGLLTAFDHADVVTLGEAHSRRVDSDLRLRLIQHPAFPTKARFIVVEFARTIAQPILARYIDGEDVPLEELQQVWQDPSLPAGSAAYPEFFAAVRSVNGDLPQNERLRVLAANPLADRSKLQTQADRERYFRERTEVPVSLLREQVLANGEKALVVFGSGHLWRGEGGVTRALQETVPGRVFVVDILAPVVPRGTPGPEFADQDQALLSLEETLSSVDRPVLVSLVGTPAAALPMNPFFLGQALLPDDVALDDVADACVYFGRSAHLGELVPAR